jgi:hypothetical protein
MIQSFYILSYSERIPPLPSPYETDRVLTLSIKLVAINTSRLSRISGDLLDGGDEQQ